MIIDDLQLFVALRRLPEYNLSMVAGSVGRALLVSCEWERSAAKVEHAQLLLSIQDSASKRLESIDPPG
jgi:hypothetical protein